MKTISYCFFLSILKLGILFQSFSFSQDNTQQKTKDPIQIQLQKPIKPFINPIYLQKELKQQIAIIDIEYLFKIINQPQIDIIIQEKKKSSQKEIDHFLSEILEKKELIKSKDLDPNLRKNYIIDIENLKSNIAKIIYKQNKEIRKKIQVLNTQFIKTLLTKLENIQVKNKYFLILDKKSVLFAQSGIEITDQILKILLNSNKNYGNKTK